MRSHSLSSAVAALAFLSAPLAIGQTLPGPNFPNYKTADEISAVCDKGIDGARSLVSTLEGKRADKSWLAAFDDLNAYIEDAQGPIDFVQNVHPDKPVRDAAQACSLKWAEWLSGVAQNEKLYAALRKVPKADAIDAEFVRQSLAQFEDAGVSLPKAKQARAKEIRDKLVALEQSFAKNIRDAGTKVVFTEAELKGVPGGVWEKAPRDDQGRVVLGVDDPTMVPVLRLAESAATRERMWWAKFTQGGDANLKNLAEIAKLRTEYAALFGFKNYVDFNLRRRMAKNGATANAFLGQVGQAVRAKEKQEIEELRRAKAEHLGTALGATTIQRWDFSFYSERVRRAKYAIEQEAFRQYFPSDRALGFVMRVVETMMGVRFTKVENALWHPEAETYLVTDVASGKSLAQLYVDLFPREGKYNHAAVWPLRGSATRNGRTPAASLVVNFDRKGLTLGEMETLLHEFGHAVHVALSQTRYAGLAGTSVMLDFVEAPSQMLEEWVYDRKVLDLMQAVCATCPRVPDALLEKARAAKDYGMGSQFSRQQLYASYDLALHARDNPDPMALWAKMEGQTPMGHVAGSKFPSGFAHLAGGYGAGYYGYLWSLVVAMDMRTAFAKDMLSPAVGMRYRNKVLGQGAQKPAPQLVKDFLGRPFNNQAFFAYLKR